MSDYWNYLAQQRIDEAQEQGELDVPAMHGKALDLTENPFIPEDQRLAYKLLKDNDLSPAWIIDGKEIRERIDSARASLSRAHALFEQTLHSLDQRLDIDAIYARQAAYSSWDKARDQFRHTARSINKLIETYNLRVPLGSLQRLYFNAERELERLESRSDHP
jgi:Domain of unknown function (DUF1992)